MSSASSLTVIFSAEAVGAGKRSKKFLNSVMEAVLHKCMYRKSSWKSPQGRCLYIVTSSARRETDLQLTNRSRWRYDIQIQFNLHDSLSSLQGDQPIILGVCQSSRLQSSNTAQTAAQTIQVYSQWFRSLCFPQGLWNVSSQPDCEL